MVDKGKPDFQYALDRDAALADSHTFPHPRGRMAPVVAQKNGREYLNSKLFFSLTFTVLLLSLILALFLDLPIAVYAETLSPYKPLAEGVSLLGHAIPWLLLVLAMMLVCRQSLLRPGLAILAVYGITGLIVAVLKFGFGRYRPGKWFSSELYGLEPLALTYQDCSFPSGHSQTIFAFMVAFGFVFPRGKYYFWTIGSAVALSRIVVNYHYASDVVVGSYIGIVGAIVSMKALLPQQGKGG